MASQFSRGQKQARIAVEYEPLRAAFGRTHEDELSIVADPAQMFDVGAGKRIAAHDSITWLPRPATLDCQRADAAP